MFIVCIKDFNLNDINFTDKHKNRGGGEAVYLSYNKDSKLLLQTDKLFCQNGIMEENYIEVDVTNIEL